MSGVDEMDFDRRLRAAAMAWLEQRTSDGTEAITSRDLLDFTFEGQPFRLMDAQRGIRKPAGLPTALSIRTVYASPGQPRPYDDDIGADGLPRYKWRGEEPDHPENRALRTAMQHGLPLIWFFGVGPAQYKPIFPVYLLWEEPGQQQFVIDPADVAGGLVSAGSVVEDRLRRYFMQETKRRLHQPVFRASVLRAYEYRCAVCSLRHAELLDAAHIIPDSLPKGIPTVPNGLAMCKIHHAAYDRNILGIRPDFVVQIRRDVLDERDGPMLEHGLQGRHGERLMVVPRARAERPDVAALENRYETFLRAS